MTTFSALFLLGFVLNCMLPSCRGKVYPLHGKKKLFFKIGSTAEIQWKYGNDVEQVQNRVWFIKRSNAPEEQLAIALGTDTPTIHFNWITIKDPATLVLRNVNQSFNGIYKFQLIARKGSDASEVNVVIAVAPKMTVKCSRSTTISKGDNIKCVCKGEGGNPKANVTWYGKDEIKIGETGEEKATLQLTNVDKDDRGKYKCVAFGHELAQNETSIKLTVHFAPENVRVMLSSEIAARGKSFTIKCEAEAEPSPIFKIFFNGTEVPIIEDTYIIPKVNDSHVGFYKCVANNTLGLKNSTPRFLRVENAETHGNDDDAGLSTGAIVGIIIGVLVLVLVVAIVCLLKLKKKNHGHERVKNDNPTKTPSGSTSNQPHEYAVLEKPEPVTYAALDKQDLKKGGPEKPARTNTPTEYADIQVS